MIQTQATILRRETIAPAWWRLTLSAPTLTPPPQPGQFLLVDCPPAPCYLRRSVFPAEVTPEGFSFLLRPDPDPGLAWLLTRQPGDTLDVIGPLGSGFPLPAATRHLLLVADTPHLGPLLAQMRRAIAAKIAVTLAMGGSRALTLYPLSALPPVVEVQAATLDGSLGHRGSIIEVLPPLLGWADVVCAVGTSTLYRSLKSLAGQVRLQTERNFLYGLLTGGVMACGMGACLSCVVETESGLKPACLAGPVFDLTTVEV